MFVDSDFLFRACYGVLRFVMESGALGCEVIVSGKLRAQRAKAMKFEDGYMIKAGNPCRHFIDSAVRHVLLRQGEFLVLDLSLASLFDCGYLSGVLGIKVNIMLPHDPQGKMGPKKPMPDKIDVFEPKEDVITAPSTDAM